MITQTKTISVVLILILSISIFLLRFSSVIDQTLTPRLFLTSILLLLILLFQIKRKKIQNNLYVLIFFIYYLYSIVSSLWSNTISEAIFESQIFCLSLILIFIFHSNNQIKNLILISKILSLISLIGSLIGIIYILKNNNVEYSDIGLISGNKNLYSSIQFLFIPFILYSILKSRSIYFWFVLLLNFINIAIFQTRSIYLSLIIVTAFFIIILIYNFTKSIVIIQKNIKKGIVFSLLLITILLGINNNFLNEKTKQTFKTKTNLLNISEDRSFDERLLLWEKSIYLIKENFFWGVGSGNWKIEIGKYYQVQIPWLSKQNQTFNYPHNELIAVFSELGVFGFILFLILLLLPVFFIIKCFIKKHFTNEIIIFSPFYIGFIIFILVDFPFRRIEHSVLFFLMGYIIIELIPYRSPPLIINSIFPNLVAVILLLFTAIVGYFNLNGESYSKLIFLNERKNDNLVLKYTKQADSFFYKVLPNTLPLKMFEGEAFFFKNDLKNAIQSFEQSLKETPNSVRVLNNYASVLNNLGLREEAKLFFKKAIKLDNYYDDAKLNLSIIYHYEGNVLEAINLLEQTEDSSIKNTYMEFYKSELKKL